MSEQHVGPAGGAKPVVVDAHVHRWNCAEQRLPWLDPFVQRLGGRRELDELERIYTHGGLLDVRGLVYVEVDAADAILEDRLVSAQADPRILGYVMRSQLAPDMRVPVFACGIREPLHTPQSEPGRCLEQRFLEGLRALGAAGLAFDACVRTPELADLARACQACPGATVVLDHVGNVSPESFTETFQSTMRELAASPNVYVKVSGYPTADAGFVRDLLEFLRQTFRSDRLMYASNWPVIDLYGSLEQHVSQLLEVFGADADFFAHNACRAYGLSLPTPCSV